MMRIGLIWKLLGVLLLNAAIIIGVMASAMYISVSQNFTNYVQKMDQDRFQQVVEVLEGEYAKAQSWSKIRPAPQRWLMGIQSTETYSSANQSENSNQRLGFNREYQSGQGRYHQMGMRLNRYKKERSGSNSYENKNHLTARDSLLLLNADKEKIWGPNFKREPDFFQPIHFEDEVVGWLGMYIPQSTEQKSQVYFMDQQLKMLSILSVAAVVTAAVISFLLSKYLLRPVQKLTHGTQSISERQFQTRVRISSKDEFGDLAKNFNSMAETLESFEKQRQQWISDISHELGTPLSVLRGEIEALQDGIREPSPDQFNSLHAEVMQLARIVDDLKLINKAEAGKLEMSLVEQDPVRLYRQFLEQYSKRLKEHELELVLDLPEKTEQTAMIDPDRFRQVLGNLLENAIRYVPSPATISGKCFMENESVTLILEDNGPGVSDESLPYLFDRFFRADQSRNRMNGGSGLGLAICMNLVEAHGGTIHAEKVNPSGLRILIRLPFTANS